jgi:hypothetical protein
VQTSDPITPLRSRALRPKPWCRRAGDWGPQVNGTPYTLPFCLTSSLGVRVWESCAYFGILARLTGATNSERLNLAYLALGFKPLDE